MNEAKLLALLARLRAEPRETEWLEFKASRCGPQDLGKYLSALANSACLHGQPRAFLVFGVVDETHEICGTAFDPWTEKAKGNQALLLWLATLLEPNAGFEVYPLAVDEERVVIFVIGPAVDQPVKFQGVAYIRVGTSTTVLSNYPEKERAIWGRRVDWSAQVREGASIADLDPEAIRIAREQYGVKNPSRVAEVTTWDDATFLNKAKLTIKGGITNAAIILLGREESAGLISPAVARISWVLRDEGGIEVDYQHFGPPFLLNVNKVLARLRNLMVRALPGGTLFPVEMTQYDDWVIREALHNCIAHQDYGLGGRINVVETPDRLTLTNPGCFLPGSVEKVITQDAPPEIYRSPFLAEAMVNLNMIDTQGGGIKRMFLKQRARSFPLPDYDLSEPSRVVVTIRGRILDERYTRLLMERTDLDLPTVMLLDKVQKHVRITRDEHRRLKSVGLVEGRYPSLLVSGQVAAAVGEKARHIRDRGLDDQYYLDLIIELVRKHGPVDRKEIDRLLQDKLPEVLSDTQKAHKVHNLLSRLARRGVIVNKGTRRYSRWRIADSPGRKTNG
jgi:ATP-dependent DNA helicase RecG